MLNRIIKPAVQTLNQIRYAPTVRGLAAYKGAPPPVTMDDLPVPCGSWETQYNTNQTKYNTQLAVGVIFAVITLIAAKATGLVYLNYSPPRTLPEE
uniref:Putative conserved plasma membrane protein n=1 Tax=Rhodnius neglectus TaxID=72488 RepID=A0A0P4VVX3_9HEMI